MMDLSIVTVATMAIVLVILALAIWQGKDVKFSFRLRAVSASLEVTEPKGEHTVSPIRETQRRVQSHDATDHQRPR